MEKNSDFQYYMHIIWYEPFELDHLGQGADSILTYGEKGSLDKKV